MKITNYGWSTRPLGTTSAAHAATDQRMLMPLPVNGTRKLISCRLAAPWSVFACR